MMGDKKIAEICTFWLSNSLKTPEFAVLRKDWWYKGGKLVDEEIQERFADCVDKACNGELMVWNNVPDGALALILLLDQFTRNLYRNTVNAYRGDLLAYQTVQETIQKGLDLDLHPVKRIWLYHPFHHSESLEQQDYGIALLQQIHEGAPRVWREYIKQSIVGWTRHRDIVAQFGRFPHRNEVLSRPSTPEEIEFLASHGDFFGQGPKPGHEN